MVVQALCYQCWEKILAVRAMVSGGKIIDLKAKEKLCDLEGMVSL